MNDDDREHVICYEATEPDKIDDDNHQYFSFLFNKRVDNQRGQWQFINNIIGQQIDTINNYTFLN